MLSHGNIAANAAGLHYHVQQVASLLTPRGNQHIGLAPFLNSFLCLHFLAKDAAKHAPTVTPNHTTPIPGCTLHPTSFDHALHTTQPTLHSITYQHILHTIVSHTYSQPHHTFRVHTHWLILDEFFSILQCDLLMEPSDVIISYLPLAHMYERILRVSQQLRSHDLRLASKRRDCQISSIRHCSIKSLSPKSKISLSGLFYSKHILCY